MGDDHDDGDILSSTTGGTPAGQMDGHGDRDNILSFVYRLAMRIMYLEASIDLLRVLLPSITADGTAGAGAAPASDEAIQALKDVPIASGGDGDGDGQMDCTICLDHDDIAAAAAGWKEMPCGHQFHGGCLEKWLRMHGTCPMCRHQLMPTAAAEPAEEEVENYWATSESLVVMTRVRRSGGANDGDAAPVEGMDDYRYNVYEIPLLSFQNP